MGQRTQRFIPIVVLLLVLLTVSSSCGETANSSSNSPAANIEITGTVKFDTAYSPVGAGGGAAEYRVEVTLKNGGGEMFSFDEAEGAFTPASGKALRMSTTNIEKGVFEIEAGDETKLEYGTDGYTPDLYADANGGTLFFMLTLYQDDTVVYGPRIAPLPDIFELMKETEPRALVFE